MENMILLHHVFENTAKKFPDNIAIDVPKGPKNQESLQFTYKAIDEKANALAKEISLYVKEESIIAIMLPRNSHHIYVAQLAVLKAGAAYTCIDTAMPEDRVKFIMEDSGAPIVITNKQFLNIFNTPKLDIEEFDSNSKNVPIFNTPSFVRNNNLAYVIYTSGTTGKPKGVMIEHHSVLNLVLSDIQYFNLNEFDRCAQNSSTSYDSSVEEIWLAFGVGATLVVADDNVVRLGPDLGAWLKEERISVFCPPPTLIKMGICNSPQKNLPELKLVYFGGEPLPKEIVDAWAPGRHLENGYGPTECTITCTRTRLYQSQKVTIGKPILNTFAVVLNDNLEEVKNGDSGELFMGGACLARGYLNRDDLTKEKFIFHPKFKRIYKTGDLVSIDEKGDIVYIGRIDSQVKIRGHRVELSEIEEAICAIEGVKNAACKLQNFQNLQAIIAYLIPKEGFQIDFANIKKELEGKLPKYMIPAHFMKLKEIPISPLSGKLNRNELPDFKAELKERNKSIVLPSNETEDLILLKMKETFSRDIQISTDDDFFDIGGDSLSAATLISKLRENKNTSSLTVRDLYENPTIKGMTKIVENQKNKASFKKSNKASENNMSKWATLTTGLQLLLIVILLMTGGGLAFFSFFHVFPLLVESFGIVNVVLLFPLIGIFTFAVYFFTAMLFAIILKKALIGSYRSGKHPVLGAMYFKNWLINLAVRMVPLGTIEGTEFKNIFLRLLGAKIGKNVFIHKNVNISVSAWDLLEIGDNVTIGRDVSIRTIDFKNGELIFDTIKIGNNCTLGTRASMSPGSAMEDGSMLTPLSMLPEGSVLKSDETWEGVPASFKEKTKPPQRAEDGEISPQKHGLFLIFFRLMTSSFVMLLYCAFVLFFFLFGKIDSTKVLIWFNSISFSPYFFVNIAIIVILSQIINLILQAGFCRVMGKIKPGNYSIYGKTFIKICLKDRMVETAGNILSGTLFWPYWLRLAGMKVGKNCEISTIIDVVPELVTISDEVFFADGIYLGTPQIHRGVVSPKEVYLETGTFIGNHAVIPAGSKLPKDILVGICTVADSEKIIEGSSWFGHPSFRLPRREVLQMDKRLTHNPVWYRFITRLFWESARFFLPILPIFLNLFWLKVVYYFYRTQTQLLFWGILLHLCIFAFLGSMLLSVLAMKWLLLGKVKPDIHPLWSCWCSRWDFLYVAWTRYAKSVLVLFEGTLFIGFWLRAMGAKIGKKVILGSGFSQVVDPDMLNFGDYSTVLCQFQAHSFEDRILKIAPVIIKKNCTVGNAAVLLYGADIGESTHVFDNSVVMKQEKLLPESSYIGCPTRPC